MLDHVAIWTKNLESVKDFYIKYFEGSSNNKYINSETGFESYFITFKSGSRIEIMRKPGIPDNLNDEVKQHQGLIHLAFGVESTEHVVCMCDKMKKDGVTILRGPRKTGDGYFEFEALDPDGNRIEVTSTIPA
ncbi:MAG TPA: VOC family protein [Bacteroidales bacterium]|nr:VOC family protein [Bacteroidales bacterium]